MENYTQDEVIDLKEFFVYILRRWRLLLAAMLILAVLLGGFEAVTGCIAGQQPVLSAEEIEEAKNTIAANETTIQNDQASLLAKQKELAGLEEVLADYQATLALAMAAKTVSTELITSILELNDSIASTQNQISSANQSISSLNNEITSLQSSNASLSASLEETVSSFSLKSVIIKFVIGAVLGAVIICVYAFCRWFFSRSLRSVYELQDQYSLPVLGSAYYPQPGKGARKSGRIDAWVNRLGGFREQPDVAGEYAAAAAKLQVLSGDKRKIMVTGTLDKQKLEEACNSLKNNIHDGGCEIFWAENPMRHPQAILQITDCDILLVEGVGVSGRREIRELLEFLRLSKASVLGTFIC